MSRRFVVPTALTMSLLAPACSSPTTPGACVTRFEPPADASAPAPGVRPQFDIAPCPAQKTGPDWFCITATGCQVEYEGGVTAVEGAPLATVSCVSNDRCLWGIDATGAPILGTCPLLDVQPQECRNVIRFDDPSRSAFQCSTTLTGCTLPSGRMGQQLANVTRVVTGGVSSSDCPTPCTPFS